MNDTYHAGLVAGIQIQLKAIGQQLTNLHIDTTHDARHVDTAANSVFDAFCALNEWIANDNLKCRVPSRRHSG